MIQKRPIGIMILSIITIIYALLDIGQFFMPIETESRIEYAFPILGILFLPFGIGAMAIKEWARKGIIFSYCIAIVITIFDVFQNMPSGIILNCSFILFFFTVIVYFSRREIRQFFTSKSEQNKNNGI